MVRYWVLIAVLIDHFGMVNADDIDVGCVSKGAAKVYGTRVVIPLSNRCGVCVNAYPLITLNGVPQGLVGGKIRMESGVTIQSGYDHQNKIGEWRFDITRVATCN
jgi:hypothetical protein